MGTDNNCNECGAKPVRSGVILQHRRGCSHRKDKEVVQEAAAPESGPKTLCKQCGTAMRRLNCGGNTHGPVYSACKHGHGLEDDCEECRVIQHGRLAWGCPGCKVEYHEGRSVSSMNYEIRGEVDFGH